VACTKSKQKRVRHLRAQRHKRRLKRKKAAAAAER